MVSESDKWLLGHTLAKDKPFYWKIDDAGNIYIKRKFKHAKDYLEQKLSNQELNKLDEFMSDREWKSLANSVSKLGTGTEKSGVGWFLYHQLGMDGTAAQLSSQLGTIFTNSGAWLYNGKKKNIEFKKNTENWFQKVNDYYAKG